MAFGLFFHDADTPCQSEYMYVENLVMLFKDLLAKVLNSILMDGKIIKTLADCPDIAMVKQFHVSIHACFQYVIEFSELETCAMVL